MYTSTFYTAALLSLLSMARAGGEPGAAGMCNNLVTSLAACSSQSAAFYATVTDEAQAMATAAACICYSSGTFNAAAVDAGLSACVAELGTATTVVPELGVTVDGDNLTPYYGFCNAYAPTATPTSSPTHSGSTSVATTAAPMPTYTGAASSLNGLAAVPAALGAFMLVVAGL